jgi:1,2-beta-oligoglucan phosphorylase
MVTSAMQHLTTPRRDDLGLERINNRTGLEFSRLPNGAIFALEHVEGDRRLMINQTLGSPIAAGLSSLLLRIGAREAQILTLAGAAARGRIGAAGDQFVWAGESARAAHAVTLQLQPDQNLWLWRVEVTNRSAETLPCDAILIQDLGLGDPGFLMNNEAYASQYLDHHIAAHPRMGHVLMARQNLAQAKRHPWVAHGCVEGTIGFATDFRQLLGPAHRDADDFCLPFGTSLPSIRLQHESACAALQSTAVMLAPGAATSWTFFGLYRADHPGASGDADLALIDETLSAGTGFGGVGSPPRTVALSPPPRSYLLDAPSAVADPLSEPALRERYPHKTHLEWLDGRLLSFFTPADPCSRHVVVRDKERTVLRRHGAILVSGTHMLPDERTLCVTCWMHGVFGAQLTVGNTSFHRLLSVSRDPYNITRGSGLRLLVDLGEGWRLLTVPSVFEMGLTDCQWVYQLGARTIAVSAVVSGEEAAVQWRVAVAGEACRFLLCGHLVMGEQEFAHAAPFTIDSARKRCSFRPEPKGLWSQRYPEAVYHLVTSTPECLEALGSDELLYGERAGRTGAYLVLRTKTTNEFIFAVVGSLTDPRHAEWLAVKFAGGVADAVVQAGAAPHWRSVTRGIRIESADGDAGVSAVDTVFPWLVHDAMVHLTVPHGLEQYNGGAWGTRDVCQGPLELLLALEHDPPAKAILQILFAQQYAQRGDWPQWFMLEPYSAIQSREAHGDVIIWPLKALCDYLEATGDFAILAESIPWRREDTRERSTAADPIAAHVDKLIATVRERFVPGTHLMRYGNGDWNDSLQPVDPAKRDWMVSSWTVGLLYEQLRRYAIILRRAGRADGAAEDQLAAAIANDCNRFLIRDGTVAGYGVFSPAGGPPELLFHPADQRTGVSYSLLPMTQAMLGGLFTGPQAEHHLALIKRYLTFPDGVRLMDTPLAYHGGPEVLFQRAESAAFFGREIGLMYTHAHLRQAQAMALLGEGQEAWDALLTANPVAVTERLAEATLRQRNSYFSSSDAAFRDRYQASAEWERVRGATMGVDGGWRIYSSGPGLYINVLLRYVFGVRRDFGTRIVRPCLPPSVSALTLTWPGRPPHGPPLQ